MRRSRVAAHHRAFTFVELLVVVGIIAVLIGLLLPAIGRARAASRDTRSMSNLRQMMLGYTMYHQQNRGWVLFGYTPATVNGGPIVVDDLRSGQQFFMPIADRYPWRLVPYVSDIWEIIHSHDVTPPTPAYGDTAVDAWMKAYTLSVNPTYGINATYVGGHKSFDGFTGPALDHPNTGKHVVFMANEVKRSPELIVFADCQSKNMAANDGNGLHYLTPPRAKGQKWTIEGNGQFKLLNPDVLGLPKGWHTPRTVTAFFDGHVEALLPGDLEDMRLWANWATSKTYDYQ